MKKKNILNKKPQLHVVYKPKAITVTITKWYIYKFVSY